MPCVGANLLGLDAPGQTESAHDRDIAEEETMSFEIGHVHLKCADPKKTADYYINNFGGKLLAEIPGRGFRVDLHGLQLNITVKIDSQNHPQYLGIEHLAVQTDDYASTMATVRKNGVKVLEELNNNGRHVAFIEAPDGAQFELIEKV
jgi:catechol 2,3-dioxygenase-like lactoylglutathione lyase family enzyme